MRPLEVPQDVIVVVKPDSVVAISLREDQIDTIDTHRFRHLSNFR
jgi:hypothetical protein